MEISKLSQIIDLCRKKGVESIEIEGIKITLSTAVPSKRPYKKKSQSKTPEVLGELMPTPEELLMWSVTDGGALNEGN